jgi:hypothetical protein
VVARASPGAARAALGLHAAIPAVIIYNVFSRQIAGYRDLVGDASENPALGQPRSGPARHGRLSAPHIVSQSSAAGVRLNHGEDTLAGMREINVTPFIDVMLVLLIIFVIVAPLATVDIVVNLPSSTAQPWPRPDKPCS